MAGLSQPPFSQWTRLHASILAVACLSAGIAGGWLIRGFHGHAAIVSAKSSNIPTPAPSQTPSATQLDPLRPNEGSCRCAGCALDRSDLSRAGKIPNCLLKLNGNIYYDALQYQVAVDYYAAAPSR